MRMSLLPFSRGILINSHLLKDEVSLWVLFSRACSAVIYILNTTLVKSA